MNCSRILSLLCSGLLLCAAGCATSGDWARTITIRPDQRHIDYQQKFEQAYAAPASDGGYDFVLTTGTFGTSSGRGVRIHPATSAPVSHMVVIHVAWRPMAAASGDYPAAANSTVDWYAFDTRNAGAHTHYQGVGFVRVDLGERQTQFALCDVRIRPTASSPTMRDPIGASRLSGTIQARNDASQVKLLMDELSRRLQMMPATTAPATQP